MIPNSGAGVGWQRGNGALHLGYIRRWLCCERSGIRSRRARVGIAVVVRLRSRVRARRSSFQTMSSRTRWRGLASGTVIRRGPGMRRGGVMAGRRSWTRRVRTGRWAASGESAAILRRGEEFRALERCSGTAARALGSDSASVTSGLGGFSGAASLDGSADGRALAAFGGPSLAAPVGAAGGRAAVPPRSDEDALRDADRARLRGCLG